MSKKIIISTPRFPWFNNHCSIQGYYLLKLFIEENYDVFYVVFEDKSLVQRIKTFDQVANMKNNVDENTPNTYLNNDNLELFKKCKYCTIENGDVNDATHISNYNTIRANEITEISRFNVNGAVGASLGFDEFKLRAQYIYGFTNILSKLNKENFTEDVDFKGNQSMLLLTAMFVF